MRRRVTPVIMVLIMTILIVSCSTSSTQPTAVLSGCGIPLQLDIRATPQERSQGLMGVRDLPEGYGMLFLWPEPSDVAFWMKDTIIPLDVVYFDEQMQILDIVSMQPGDLTPHPAPQPIMYAVEVPHGHFARYGVTPGMQCTLDIPEGIIVQ